MTCHDARQVLPELLDRRTPPTALLEARSHLAACVDCQRDFASLARITTLLDSPPPTAPSTRLRRSFYAMLEEEKHSAASARQVADRQHRAYHLSLWRWVIAPLAACALLAAGFIGGSRFSSAPRSGNPADSETAQRLAELQHKVDSMGQLVGFSLLQQQQRPTNDRLRGIFASTSLEKPTARVVHELISALALDPSAHVRLCALDGLIPHVDQEVVRAGVLACLAREENPLVQISMIDFLATARDGSARSALERITVNETADRSVRDAARLALAQF
jgi:anti-sigma factor RsiW